MKIGISISIDVSKIDKARLFKGKKGTYMDLTAFIDLDNKDQYDNNGFISQSVSKEEKASGVQTPILGNTKVFYTDGNSQPQQQQQPQAQPAPMADPNFDLDEDIPFGPIALQYRQLLNCM